ncbi:guanylate-binding protein 2-like [Ptychodera flava]|uniref:guanylate-binding protein 2-like n=1 Tax=Ptychodera flava TaxID=63121 RepID=UPI00396A6D1C
MSKTYGKRKCVPLCYPDNYKWDKVKGKLVEKEKSRGQLVVCEDALEMIRSIDGPICPVAVTGPARSGKSYIASQLIEPRTEKCVFQTSAKMNPLTMGIWMSTNMFKKRLSNGTEVTVIILDTEGLDAYNAHEQDDMLMFALMALMSSVLVYNNKGSVGADDIKKLSWVNKFNDVFSLNRDAEGNKATTENEFIRFFPNFIWLLRDTTMSFTLIQDDEEVEVDFKNYLLNEVLKLEKENITTETRVKERNATRRALLKSFPVFDALTLPIPTLDKSVLEDMDKGKNTGKLNKDFLKDVDAFITRCGTLMKPKKAWPYAGNINGHQFTKMLRQYVSGFSATKSINMHAVVTSVIDALLVEEVERTFVDYRKAMDEYAEASLPCQPHEIIMKHNTCLFKSMRKFTENTKYINDAELLNKYKQELKGQIVKYDDQGSNCVGGYLYTILIQNEKESETFCTDLVETLVTEINIPEMRLRSKRLHSHHSLADYINKQYKKRARGPRKLRVYKTVLAEEIVQMSKHKEISTSEPAEQSTEETDKIKKKIEKGKNGNLRPSLDVTAEKLKKMEIRQTAEQINRCSNSDKLEQHTEETKPAAEAREQLPEDATKEDIEKGKDEEQIRTLKAAEDEEMLKMMNEDITDQQDQSHADYLETSAAIEAQITAIGRTHEDLARELQLLNAKLQEENKRLKEELNRKREVMMRRYSTCIA